MHTSIHPSSIFFLGVLMLGQFSCLVIHTIFLKDSWQLCKLADYAQSLNQLLLSYQLGSGADVDQSRKQAQVRKELLASTFEQEHNAIQWVAVEMKASKPYLKR